MAAWWDAARAAPGAAARAQERLAWVQKQFVSLYSTQEFFLDVRMKSDHGDELLDALSPEAQAELRALLKQAFQQHDEQVRGAR